jgi:hypothetical protein
LDEIDYDFNAETRLKKIKSFISFTKKLSSVSKDEYELFLELQESIKNLLSPEEV